MSHGLGGLERSGEQPILNVRIQRIVDLKQIVSGMPFVDKLVTRRFDAIFDQVRQGSPVFVGEGKDERIPENVLQVSHAAHQVTERMLVPMKPMREDLIVLGQQLVLTLVECMTKLKELVESLIQRPVSHPAIQWLLAILERHGQVGALIGDVGVFYALIDKVFQCIVMHRSFSSLDMNRYCL